MEQAKNYVCKHCSSAVPIGHKFCGTCGAPVPSEIKDADTHFFNPIQAPGKARLVLVRGVGGAEGLSYLLQGESHIAGREEGQILFPEDNWISAKHANFVYENDQLVVLDEGSKNGVFIRIKGAEPITVGQEFLCGEQVFKAFKESPIAQHKAKDETFFYGSPTEAGSVRVLQVLEGGGNGMECCARSSGVTIGREGGDMNFPEDIYMSGGHARVELDGTNLRLVDTESRNGTFIRINGRQPLNHGDYLFIGRQLLRVEVAE